MEIDRKAKRLAFHSERYNDPDANCRYGGQLPPAGQNSHSLEQWTVSGMNMIRFTVINYAGLMVGCDER